MKNYHVGMRVTNQQLEYGDILLGKGCYIGLNVTILPGVHIGEGAVIGSCALVTKDIPAWTIAAGVPAKVIRSVREDL
jgi:acetyltransferase-like isoleucine patch superfamily enzyme